MHRYLVGIDVSLAVGAAADGAVVGLSRQPDHVTSPVFDPALPGSWLVGLSHVDCCSRVLSRNLPFSRRTRALSGAAS